MSTSTNTTSIVLKLLLALSLLAVFKPDLFQDLLGTFLQAPLAAVLSPAPTPVPANVVPALTTAPATSYTDSANSATAAKLPPESAGEPNRQHQHPPQATMSWFQKQFTLPSQARGSYLITDIVVKELPEIKDYKVGLLNLFVQHTSCALSLNENWDEDVRTDMSDALDRIAPDAGPKGEALYQHSAEGPDDMPAHIKSALIGASVTVPIRDGKLATGTWQGIWYLEFRAWKHTRKVVATIQGEKA